MQELQIVPDYDPLEELVIGEEPEQSGEKIKEQPNKEPGKADPQEKPGKALWQSKLFWQLFASLAAIAACFGIFLLSYRSMGRGNDYAYQLRKGEELMEEERYEEALPYLKQAQSLQADSEGADTAPLRLLAEAYAKVDAKELAVGCMQNAIFIEDAARGANYELEALYLELMELLNEVKQTHLIQEVIDSCKYDGIKEKLLPYRVEKPICSLPEGTYHYYVNLELDAEYGAVYYTLDGTEPTKDSTRYEKPISLTEGENLLCAVAINKKGMVSEPLVQIYRLEFQYDPDMDEED
ncbi:MAG: hypothetical protein HFI26_09330 [Lachnospiraceae bacterium]|nr:hypothetical protein [Lachnospiraceae bacterium]